MSGIHQAVLAGSPPPAVHGSAAFTSSGSWTVPAGVTSVTLEAIGKGADGGSGHAAGGGGGSYAKSTGVAVSPGMTIYFDPDYYAGAWANTSNTTPASSATGVYAGSASGSTGGSPQVYSGGNGYAGGNGGGYGGGGGGGGSSIGAGGTGAGGIVVITY